MKKRKFIDAAEEQRLAVHYNEELLRETFSSDICLTISDYLPFVDLVALCLTCGYFYRGNVLDKAFNEYIDCFPVTQTHRKQVTQESQISSFERIKQRITPLIDEAESKWDKWIIKRWLLIDKKSFYDNDKLFLTWTVNINWLDPIGVTNSERINAYQFFSYIGSVKHILIMRDCIDNRHSRHVERSLLEDNHFNAFRLAVTQRNVDLLKLLFNFINDDPSLKEKLLESEDFLDVFIKAALFSAQNGCDDAVRLLWGFIDNDECKERILSHECFGVAFCQTAIRGHVKTTKLFSEFLIECGTWIDKKFERRALRFAAQFDHFEVVKLLWEFVDDEALKDEVLNKFVRAGNVEAIKFWSDKKCPSYNSMFNSCSLT